MSQHGAPWTEDDIALLKDDTLKTDELEELLPERSRGAIVAARRKARLGLLPSSVSPPCTCGKPAHRSRHCVYCECRECRLHSYDGTGIRSVRVPLVRWRRAQARAREEGTTLSEEINAYLEAYGTGEPSTSHVRYG